MCVKDFISVCTVWINCDVLVSLPSIQTEYAHMEGGKYVFRIHRSPMCEYMINFIHKLKHLPEKYMMNSKGINALTRMQN